MEKTVLCKKSKAGKLYLISEKNGINTLVLLVKDNKAYRPKLKEGNAYDVTFTGYKLDPEKKIVTLFGVDGI
jgi:hypothetical protein